MENLFEINNLKGLSEEEASVRLAKEGYNELPFAKQRSIFEIAFGVVKEPMFLLLVACGTIYLILGDVQEALMLLGFVFFVMGITLYQERKTERALEALRTMSSPRALVIREGDRRSIAGREVVRGDILVVSEGDRVPADCVILSCSNFSVDESLLTGESIPVRKAAWDGKMEMSRPGGDDLPFIYSGTMVVSGRAIAEVKSVGVHTEIGRIGKALQTVESGDSPLQVETRRLVKNLTLIGLSLCTVVIVVYGLTRGDWIKGFLAGITMAMAMLPEEFPVVLTIFLALGAWRISQKRVLTRRIPTIETLGSATVLCVDKTGTLTMNQMAVEKILANGEFYHVDGAHKELPEKFHEILEYSILASQHDPFDPMEKAFKKLGEDYLAKTEHLHSDWSLVHEYPLSQELLALSHVWKSPDGGEYVIASKGAPEAIADLCHLSESDFKELARNIDALAGEGLRILGVAKSSFKHTDLPDKQHDFKFEFLGLVGLADPVRPNVPAALKECYSAGIRVIMITGDYTGTAQNIGRQIRLRNVEEVITGPQLDEMGDEELKKRIRTVNIFARVVPEQKLRIVDALKTNGEIVAMTGDGVNDAPALKSAHIGIAMGGRGTDVARESAALVLLDDDFSSIVDAIRMGRRIFHNLRKAMAYILAIHVPIAGMSLIPVLLKWPLVLMPFHIVFLELIIDPACSVVFEAETGGSNVMKRPPRNPKEPLFGRKTITLSLLQGVSVLLIVLAVFVVGMYLGLGEREARAMTFTTLIVGNISLILTNRSWSRTILTSLRSPNAALWWILCGAALFLGIVLYVPFLQNVFLFSPLSLLDLTICLGGGIISVMWFEGLKVVSNMRNHPLS